MEIVHMEIVDSEDLNQRLVAAELKLWRRIEDIAYEQGKAPDEVYTELMIQFADFVEQKAAPKKTKGRPKTKKE